MTTQAPRLGQRQCPVLEGTPRHCGAVVRPGHLMCTRHWAQLPDDLKRPMLATNRAWQRTSTDTRWDAYMETREAALAYFTRTPETAEHPSDGLTWDELDTAALVLVIAPDGTTRMWFGGDRPAAAKALQRVWADLSTRTEPAADAHP